MKTNYNEVNDENDKSEIVENKEALTPNPEKGYHLKKFPGPILNPNTYYKDSQIVTMYGMDFYRFFMSGSVLRYPMFTDPPTPRAVKRITTDIAVKLTANTETFLWISPFSRRVMVNFNSTISQFVNAAAVNAFVRYQVVCAKVTLQQVGIMSLEDGYGTVMDAVVVPSSVDRQTLETNLLSVQVGNGSRLVCVDGRKGIEAHFIGSNKYPQIYSDENVIQPDILVMGNSNFVKIPVPSDEKIMCLPDVAATYTPQLRKDGYITDLQFDQVVTTGEITEVKGTTVLAQLPVGEALFVRVSPPSIDCTVKIYLDMVIEGDLKSDFVTDVPLLTPPNPFDFQRVKYALGNVIPPLWERGSNVAYAALKLPWQYFCRKDITTRHPTRERSYSSDEVTNHLSKIERNIELSTGKNPPEELEEKEGIAYAMMDEIKPEYDVVGGTNLKRTYNIPNYVKQASEYLGMPVTLPYSPPTSNRLFMDATADLSPCSYQYFPVVDGEVAKPAIVALSSFKTLKESVKFTITTVEKKQKTITIYYYSGDYADPKEFIACLGDICKLAYGFNYHCWKRSTFAIRIFYPKKVAQKSYMYALLAAIYGGPSGCYYTGAFSWDAEKKSFKVEEISEEVVKLKAASTVPQAPLIVLRSNGTNGGAKTLINGTVPSLYGGTVQSVNDIDWAVAYTLVPMSLRLIKHTPLSQYSVDDKAVLSDGDKEPYKWYVIATNVSTNKLGMMLKENKIFPKDFLRADISRFSSYLIKKGMMVTCGELFKGREDLLNKPGVWYFKYNGILFVDTGAAYTAVKQTGYKWIREKDNEADDLDKIRDQLLEMSKEEAKAYAHSYYEDMIKSPPPEKVNAKDVMVGNSTVSKDLLLSQAQKALTGFTTRLANIKAALLEHEGLANLTTNNHLLNAMYLIRITPKIKEGFAWRKEKEFEDLLWLEKMVNVLGSGAPAIAAYLAGWKDMTTTPRITTKNLSDLIQYLRKNPVGEPVPMNEIAEESAVPKKKKKKKKTKKKKEEEDKKEEKEKKKSNKKNEKEEEDDKDDEDEKEEILDDDKVRKRNKDLAEYEENEVRPDDFVIEES